MRRVGANRCVCHHEGVRRRLAAGLVVSRVASKYASSLKPPFVGDVEVSRSSDIAKEILLWGNVSLRHPRHRPPELVRGVSDNASQTMGHVHHRGCTGHASHFYPLALQLSCSSSSISFDPVPVLLRDCRLPCRTSYDIERLMPCIAACAPGLAASFQADPASAPSRSPFVSGIPAFHAVFATNSRCLW